MEILYQFIFARTYKAEVSDAEKLTIALGLMYNLCDGIFFERFFLKKEFWIHCYVVHEKAPMNTLL